MTTTRRIDPCALSETTVTGGGPMESEDPIVALVPLVTGSAAEDEEAVG